MTVYLPRRLDTLPDWHAGLLTLKTYLIRANGRVAPAARITEAQAHLVSGLAHADGGSTHHGLGFAVLHLGPDSDRLLVGWWVNGDSLCQYQARSDRGRGAFQPVTGPFLGSVWEMAVLLHERRAWIEAMMRASPEQHAYLSNRLTAETI